MAAQAACGAVPEGGVLRLAGSLHLFVCGADGLVHWAGDTRALQQHQAAGDAVDWPGLRSATREELLALPRGEPWLSAGLLAAGDQLGLVKWETGAEPYVLTLPCRAADELFGLTADVLGRVVATPEAWAAPDALRARLRPLRLPALVAAAARPRPPAVPRTPEAATKLALKTLAGRHRRLTAEVEALDAQLARLAAEAAPALVAVKGVGPDTAAALLVAAGDNPERLASEGAFAHLCGVAPIPASSGNTRRHRLNRGEPRRQPGPLPAGPRPTRARPADARLRRPPPDRGPVHAGDPALPEAVPGPRAVPRPRQAARGACAGAPGGLTSSERPRDAAPRPAT